MSGNICDLSRISKLGGGIPGAQPLGGLLGGGAGSTGGSGMEGGSTRERNRKNSVLVSVVFTVVKIKRLLLLHSDKRTMLVI